MSGGRGNTEEPLISAWEKTVDVQQHFNDLSLRVRNFAVTVTTAVLGGAVLSFREAPGAAPWILGAGVLAWLAFYMMDAGWYHQLLLGAVAHGEDVEAALEAKGIAGFSLAKKIRQQSGVRFLGREWRSRQRLHAFYLGGIVLFVILGAGAWFTQRSSQVDSTVAARPPAVLSQRPALLFPPEGAQLRRSSGVAFGWELVQSAERYLLEVQDEQGREVLSVVLPRTRGSFHVGVELAELAGRLRWRAVPLNALGEAMHEVDWQPFSVRED